MRARVLLAVAVAAVAVVGVWATSGSASTMGSWYWSPGLCKSNLQRYGMRLDDGRTFAIAQSFCVGKGGVRSCEWNSSYSKRLYSHFVAFARSYDGVVRGFDLYPTGRNNYRAEDIELVSSSKMTARRFLSYVGQIASALARAELTKGCARYSR
jgi:hypothetical protein